MPDRTLDHPDLRRDQCRISLIVNPGLRPTPPRWVNGHCLQPVVDDDWQLCERHHGERVRLIAKYGERNSA